MAPRGKGEGRRAVSGRLRRTLCPKCRHTTLDLEVRMRVNDPPGALAGAQPKVTGKWLPVVFCLRPACDFEVWGWIDGKDAVFPQEFEEWQ